MISHREQLYSDVAPLFALRILKAIEILLARAKLFLFSSGSSTSRHVRKLRELLLAGLDLLLQLPSVRGTFLGVLIEPFGQLPDRRILDDPRLVKPFHFKTWMPSSCIFSRAASWRGERSAPS